MSQGVVAGAAVRDILLANIPGSIDAREAGEADDRNGTDWWVDRTRGHPLGIDVKVRAKDWLLHGEDDLALETWSNVEAGRVGWTRDMSKQTDFILWWWKETGRWCLIPFHMLCAIMLERWATWAEIYKTARQKTPTGNGGYHSECVFVPRVVVWREIYGRFGGKKRGAA